MNALTQHPGVSALVGTPQEIKQYLGKSKADSVLVVSVSQQENPGYIRCLFDNLTAIACSMADVLSQEPEKQALEKIVSALLPPEPVPPALLKEAAMLARARKAVLESGHWLTAANIAGLAGFSTTNPAAQPNKWKKQGRIFAVRHNNADYFPDYALDQNAGFRPLKTMAPLIEILSSQKDAWGMAYWFMSLNSFLGGQRPQDLLLSAPEKVIAAAQDEINGVTHG